MLKKKRGKRILALIMSIVFMMTTVFAGTGTMESVEAASVYEPENLLANPDFEEDKAFSPAGGSHVGNWFSWQSVSKTNTAYSGNTAAVINAGDSSIEQDVSAANLQVGQTYVYTVWAKVSNANYTSEHNIGVKNYGGSELKIQVKSTEWKKYELEFTYTSGDPRVYGWVNQHQGADLYIDNASVTVKSDIQRASIENGELLVEFVDGYTGQIAANAFTATYATSADSGNVQALTWTDSTVAGNKLSLKFPEVEAIPVEQTVTVNVTYGRQTITLDYKVAASEGEVVVANMVSVEAENGSIKVELDADPTVAPTVADFVWQYKVDNDGYEVLEVNEFAYDKASTSATATFDEIRGIPSGEQNITVKVTYNTVSKEDSFVVAKGTSNTYYVDATNGNDANDGLSSAKAFKTINKLNTITFLPGDAILFKKGETFVGCFKPQGSGIEGAPITISSYGTGNKRPVLQPGADWNAGYVMSANAIDTTATVNYVIQFYNVEYWEVNGLEIYDPNSADYLNPSSSKYVGRLEVYRSGITIQAEDIGELEHIYVDDVIIHGFHGPLTNIGKTSGGITMNVITNSARNRALSVPTQINDIRITNCEIYDVGRSGINFLTPWSFRTEAKWGPFNYGTRGYDYLPYEDFYMANNYIHDVDGDGTIIDNCSGAIAEYNLVTRCCLRPAAGGGGAAVGLFNWNSDDTIFQFNEVYDIEDGEGSTASNDSQGIEIDALNDRTWVQYNYVHDNKGGFMMLCNVSDNYRSFDGIIRYNISQNDYTHPRQGMFDIYSANYGTEVYNNTFYMTERALKPNSDQIFLFSAAGTYDMMKFYNNIFYYDGAVPAAANTFGDASIDWQSNIFYGFTNMPENDNPGAPNINADPLLVNIGNGGTGNYPGDQVDLSCYYTTADSPAINAGVPVENNGGRDYFGNKVAGIPDIGAYESGSVVLKVMSKAYAIDQETLVVTIVENEKVTAEQLMESLVYEDGITAELKRGSATLTGGVRVAEGDTIVAVYEDEAVTYVIEVAEGTTSNVIPVEDMRATAGSEETGDSNDAAINVLDGNVNTIWHTEWDGAVPADRYLTIELTNDYEVSGYIYTPRTGTSSGAGNGVITGYEIYVSNDNVTWTRVANGAWAQNDSIKEVTFATPVQAKYIKLLATQSVGNFASAAEVRLTGERIYEDTTAPTAPVVNVNDVTTSTVEITWTPSEDDEAVVEYVLMSDGKVVATFDADETSYTVADLQEETEYEFEVYAVDEAGNRSNAGVVTVTTRSEVMPNPFEDVYEADYYYDPVMWAVEEGITDGWTPTLFAPSMGCTRGQVVTFLWRAAGEPKAQNSENPFTDVTENAYYYDAVLWAVEEGITDGWLPDQFAPDMTCTRGQIVTFIWRAAGEPTAENAENPFTDVAENAYYYDAVLWAVENQITDGWMPTEFAPDMDCTRGQIVTFLYRANGDA